MYVRCIRHLYNQAIRMGDAKLEDYPFGRQEEGKYRVPQPRSIKRALSLAEIEKIFKHKALEGSPEQYFRDLWLFSYLTNNETDAKVILLLGTVASEVRT